MKKTASPQFVPAFSNKLSAMIETSGESQIFWARKFDLQIANFRKLIRGDRPAGPKLAGKIVSKVSPDMRTQLMVAYLFDTLVEITLNMETRRQYPAPVKPAALPAMVRVAMGYTDEIDLSEVLGPLEPKIRKLMAMNDPLVTSALSTVIDALIAKAKQESNRPKPCRTPALVGQTANRSRGARIRARA